jgi:hypothetical protein
VGRLKKILANPLGKIVAILLLLPIFFVVSGWLMYGPQIGVTVPVMLVLGIYFTIKRSAYAFIFTGFPLLFALLSVMIGMVEVSGYENTADFKVSILIGGVGLLSISVGLWKVLPKTSPENITSNLKEDDMSKWKKMIVILVTLPIFIFLSYFTMLGGEIILTTTIAFLSGIYFAIRRSKNAFIFLGFPLLFGFMAAQFGYIVIGEYAMTVNQVFGTFVGMVGAILITIGLWELLPGRKPKETPK